MADTAAQQSLDSIQDFFPPDKRQKYSVQSLVSILKKFIEAADLSTRLDAFVELKEWITSRKPSPAGKGMTRLETLLALMDSQAELRASFQEGVREILADVRSVELYAEAGLTEDEF